MIVFKESLLLSRYTYFRLSNNQHYLSKQWIATVYFHSLNQNGQGSLRCSPKKGVR